MDERCGGRSARLAVGMVAGWVLGVCGPGAARADDGSVSITVDKLGRFQVVEPRQHTTVTMRAEKVVLVPLFDSKHDPGAPVVPANCAYEQGTPRCTTVRGIRLQSGPKAPGTARARKIRVDCYKDYTNPSFKWIRRRRTVGTFELEDSAEPQLVRFKRRHGCTAVRLTVLELHGAAGAHVSVAEADLRYR